MAALSRNNCAHHYGRINDYIPAVFTINELFQFVESYVGERPLWIRPDCGWCYRFLASSPPESGIDYIVGRIDKIVPQESSEVEREEVHAVRDMARLSPLEPLSN